MSVGKFLNNAGWAAIAVAFAASVVPAAAAAQDRTRADRVSQEREGGGRADAGRQRNAMEIRGQRVQQANAERERQARPTTEQRATQGWNRGQQVVQSDRRTDPPARPVMRVDQAQQGERNRTYANQNRNGTYTPRNNNDNNNRGNDGTRDGRRGGDRNTSWQDNRGGNDRQGNDWRGNRGDGDRNRDSNWRDGRGDNDRDNNWRDGRRDNDRDDNWRNAGRENDRWRGDNRRWDRNWRNDRRYDWNRYRNTNRVVFRVGTYYAPYRNYSYRRFGIGAYLGSLFYSSSYWINDPWQYRLPAVYGPYRWVRYYDDVLLVDIYTGQVVDVIHNFFW